MFLHCTEIIAVYPIIALSFSDSGSVVFTGSEYTGGVSTVGLTSV